MVEDNSDNKNTNNYKYTLGSNISCKEGKNITYPDLIADYLETIKKDTEDWGNDAMHVP